MSFFNNKAALLFGGSILAAAAGVLVYLTNTKQKKEVQREFEISVINQPQEREQKEYQNQQDLNGSRDHTDISDRLVHQQQLLQQMEIENEDKQAIIQARKKLQEENQKDISVVGKTSTSSRVKVQYLLGTGQYDLTTVTAILEASLDYIGEEFVNFTQRNREERRQCRTIDEERYQELVLEYNGTIEKILLEGQDNLLSEINIDKEQFESSLRYLEEQGFYQQLFMVQSAIRQKLYDKLQKTRELTLVDMRQIISYQLEILQQQKEQFASIISQLNIIPEIAQLIPQVLNTMIQDCIFDKFGVEEEDQLFKMNQEDIIQDPEINSILSKIEEAMLALMNSIGLNILDEQTEFEELERLREQGLVSEQ